ncbi:hypothetical protein H6796_00705 [Candidatus Nomurabacteria bacterium]|nr:hypothetical protein [Candidatus Nomurabacteria bacterium]
MDFLKPRRKSSISDALYIALNVALAIVITIVIITTGSLWMALLIVLFSKWRIFSVRPHYWMANILSNLVDVVVSVGVAVFIYAAGENLDGGEVLPIQIALTVMYIVWLLFIKPRSENWAVTLQAGSALFMGVSSVFILGYDWPSSLVVLLVWCVSYMSARHVLIANREPHYVLIGLCVAFVMAELSWLLYHWTIGYSVPFGGGLQLPQPAIILTLVGFMMDRVYNNYRRNHGNVAVREIVSPVVFSMAALVVMMVFFGATGGLK